MMWDLHNILNHAHLLYMFIGLVDGASIGGGVWFEGGGGVRGRGTAAIGQLSAQRTSTLFLLVLLWVLESWWKIDEEQVMNRNQRMKIPTSTLLMCSPVRKLICMSSSSRMLWTHSFLMSMLAACSVSRSDEPRHDSTNLQGSLSTCSSMLR